MILTTGSLTIQNVVLVNFSHTCIDGLVLLVFKDTFISISVILWRSVLLLEETRKKTPTCSQVTDKLYDMKLIFFSSITGSYWTKLGCDTPWMVLFQNCVWTPCPTDGCYGFGLVENWKSLKICFFRNIGWNETKFGPTITRMVPFQNCVVDHNTR